VTPKSKVVRCRRRGDPALGVTSTKPSARPFKRALRGNCTACAVCYLFQSEDCFGFALPPNFDPEGLRLPHIQKLFARLLAVGDSELTMEEINWDDVIRKWNVGQGTIL
jgi:hypothetical protein